MITDATPDDAPALAEIYAHYVRESVATFETEPPDAAEMTARLARVRATGSPWLVARGDDGAVIGYAYAGPFHTRAAYRFTCENSIYLHPDRTGGGLGRKLLDRLMIAAEAAGFRQMVAVIAGPGEASVALHARAGFEPAGLLRRVGRKHGKWIDVHYMQRPLGAGDATPPKGEPD